jgi:hypothetical protein
MTASEFVDFFMVRVDDPDNKIGMIKRIIIHRIALLLYDICENIT